MRTKKTSRLRLFLFLILVLMAGAGIGYVLSLPIWSIKDVVVNGAKLHSPDEIKALAGIPLNENLFFSSFARSRTNLSKIVSIKDFHLYRIPPGTVLININERQPIAALIFPGKSVIIDREGYFLNRNPKLTLNIENSTDLPVVSGVSIEEVVRSEKIDERAARVINGILGELSKFLEPRKIHLELGRLENITFLLDDLLKVKVGGAEDLDRKMEVFEALLPEMADRWQKVEYVDVRLPDNPAVKFK